MSKYRKLIPGRRSVDSRLVLLALYLALASAMINWGIYGLVYLLGQVV